ncbi:alpha/beta fold hydrolase [Nocardia sp. NPDC050408]|uniref:alpha/beta fold hydrolase n=1 Tax=Nocardia sp. NPDC050408 TaxID=3364319 RepID=UPI0037A623A9
MKYPHYSDNGLTGAPAVVFLGSLGTTLEMWEPQLQAFGRHYRTIAVDLPGHGRTAVPDDRCTVRGFADQVVTLLDALGVDRFSVVGLSFGGAVAQALAGIWQDRVVGAVIACPAASYDSDFWRSRALYVRTHGLIEIVRRTADRRFAPGFARRAPDVYTSSLLTLSTMNPAGYAACCEALAAHNAAILLPRITAPTLVLAGELDRVTPPSLVRGVAEAVPGAILRTLVGCGHLANVEDPQEFNALVGAHLENSIRRFGRAYRTAEQLTGSPGLPRA